MRSTPQAAPAASTAQPTVISAAQTTDTDQTTVHARQAATLNPRSTLMTTNDGGMFTPHDSGDTPMVEFRQDIPLDVDVQPLEESTDGNRVRSVYITAFQEGPGNEVDGNYYMPQAVNDAASLAPMRRKMFRNHTAEGSRRIEDWVATIVESDVESMPDGRLRNRVKARVHDDVLWRRIQEAPEEIALSISGRGSGNPGNGPDGKQYKRLIERVTRLSSYDFVTEPGNAPKGAQALYESNAGHGASDGDDMTSEKNITIHELKRDYPELVATIEAEVRDKWTQDKEHEKAVQELQAKIDEAVAALEAEKAAHAKVADELDALKVKEAQQKKSALIESLVAEAELPDVAKTERFMARLAELDEDEMKAEIQERKALCETGTNDNPVKNAGPAKVAKSGGKLSEAQKAVNTLLGIEEEATDTNKD